MDIPYVIFFLLVLVFIFLTSEADCHITAKYYRVTIVATGFKHKIKPAFSRYHLFSVLYVIAFDAHFISRNASLVRYDLNLALRCHRFYDLAPLPVLDPIISFACQLIIVMSTTISALKHCSWRHYIPYITYECHACSHTKNKLMVTVIVTSIISRWHSTEYLDLSRALYGISDDTNDSYSFRKFFFFQFSFQKCCLQCIPIHTLNM